MPTVTVSQAFALAVAHHEAGRLGEAEALYRQILAAHPDHPAAWQRLSVLVHQAGRLDEAAAACHQALQFKPDFPEAHYNLGTILAQQGRLVDAIPSFRRALALKPDFQEAAYNLGTALAQTAQFEQAVEAYRRALQLRPDFPEGYSNLGNALDGLGRTQEAIAAFRHALQLKANFPAAHYNLANALKKQRRLDEAVAAYRQAIQLKPDYAEACLNLGSALKDQAQLDEALAAYRQARDCQPDDPTAQSNIIYTLQFHARVDRKIIADEQLRWNRRFSEPHRKSLRPHTNDRQPERRLRIGYVSPKFRDHITGRYLVPLFENHDRRNFEILCYAGVVKPDRLTEVFRGHADQWRSTVGMADHALSEMIRQDGVDVLVDLTQHMGGNRLPVFARRPAPVQVSFAGYPESTGLEAIPNRIGDRYLESEIGSDLQSSIFDLRPAEQVFLLDSFWCYDAREVKAPVNELPATENGRVTFGCLNNFCKINDPLLRLWGQVLGKVRDSHLVLLSDMGSHRQRTLEILAGAGVAAHRVSFVEPRPRPAYLELYHRLDIALDPFPCNGHMTSLDALLMGVPPISLCGPYPPSRGGLSQLSNLGLEELAAFSEEGYVNIAAQLAGDLPRLAELRRTLRSRVQASVLMDASRFARGIETAYRTMWRQWCARMPL